MVARLSRNFRSGNLAEDLGLFLLKGIAAVAEVARPEDIGLDAVANLLRPDEDGNCYAEDSFVVQLKSVSEESIGYRDHSLTWFMEQSQPMFIGLVSLTDSRISLYPTLFAKQAVLSLHATTVTLRFEKSPHAYPCHAWTGDANIPHTATAWLGQPLLQWSASDLANRNWQPGAYAVMKRFLAVARRELELLSLGHISEITWSTNDPDSIRSEWMLMRGQADGLAGLAEKCAPGLQSLMLHTNNLPPDSGSQIVSSLINLAAGLRTIGIEIDPNRFFEKMFRVRNRASGEQDDNPSLSL